ncbi:unnamed protein product [Lathyrus oleraceus]
MQLEGNQVTQPIPLSLVFILVSRLKQNKGGNGNSHQPTRLRLALEVIEDKDGNATEDGRLEIYQGWCTYDGLTLAWHENVIIKNGMAHKVDKCMGKKIFWNASKACRNGMS